jgi:hypothetical protein
MMTTEQLRRKARVMYNNDMVPDYINRHNQRQWVRSIRFLGDKWLLATPVQRKENVNG